MNLKRKCGESIPGTGPVFEKQAVHWVILGLLLLTLYGVSRTGDNPGRFTGGLGSVQWLWTAAGLAAAHQVYVWFCWRIELHLRFITRHLGRRGFSLYAFGFAVLGILRAAAVFFLAAANGDTLPVHPAVSLAVIPRCLPSTYCHSVARYFTFRRALGRGSFL